MKPFDIEAAKRGEPVCTADGREVRLYAFDAPATSGLGKAQPIVGVLRVDSGTWSAQSWSLDGLFYSLTASGADLRMATRKEARWVVSWIGNDKRFHAEGHDVAIEAEQSRDRLLAFTGVSNVTVSATFVEL